MEKRKLLPGKVNKILLGCCLLLHVSLHNPCLGTEIHGSLSESLESNDYDAAAGEHDVTTIIGLLKDKDPTVRRKAAELLGEIGDRRAVDPLIVALKDPDGDTVIAAAAALGTIGDERALVPLYRAGAVVKSVQRDGTEKIIRDFSGPTLEAYHRIMGSLETNRLLDLFHESDIPFLLEEIISRFEREGKDGIEPLRELLKNDSIFVREKAVLALGRIGDPSVAVDLIPLLDGANDNLLKAMATALGNFGGPGIESFLSKVPDLADRRRLFAFSVIQQLGPVAMDPLIPLLDHENPKIRFEIVSYILIKWKDKKTLDPLLKALRDKDGRVRKIAAMSLGQLRDPLAIDALVAALQDSERDVRLTAVSALGMVDDPAVVGPILSAMKVEDQDLREAAAGALKSLTNPLAAKPLAAALRDPWGNVRHNAASALANLDGPGVQPLIDLLKEEGVVRGRNFSAAYFLVRIGEPAVEPLIDLLDRDAPVLRIKVARALGEIKDRRAVPPLTNLLGNGDAGVRAAAVHALGEMRAEESLDPLLETLKDEDATVRANAIKAVSRYKSERSLPPLELLLADWWNKDAAAWAMLETRAPGIERLIHHLESENWVVRDTAVNALCTGWEYSLLVSSLAEVLEKGRSDAAWYAALGLSLKPRSSAELLRNIAEDKGSEARHYARWSLGHLADSSPADKIRGDLDDANPRIREIACRYLEKLKDRSFVKPLTRLLLDRDPLVQLSAARALGTVGDPAALLPLIRTLKDGTVPGRFGASWALGKLRSSEAVDPLLEALEDPSSAVRVSVILSLGEVGHSREREIIDAIHKFRDDENLDLAEAAGRALRKLVPPIMID